MLKALEVVGFKSFADKTRFEFPPGITVIVGPNGSGKSNVVDAMKWVLGEQSARSLRGKEMADVIFKGSGSGQRKPANSAEVTIIFDNSQHLLDIDAVEVHVTRRVYHGGEGEYLINGQPCRLKDIKQMFRGTGVGTDAYSLIEQGKVDSLLQASTHERRAIFEEAAGISRFKAKKVEAERRLERVQQNLLRLSDIVEEVEGRYRKLKSQASKARRYKEIADRLQALRTRVGQSDWRDLTGRLALIEARRAADGASMQQLTEALRGRAQRHRDLEISADTALESLRACEGELARIREQRASLESESRHHFVRLAELRTESARHVDRINGLRSRSDQTSRRLVAIASEAQETEADWHRAVRDYQHQEQEVARETEELDRVRDQWNQLQERAKDVDRLIEHYTAEITRQAAILDAAAPMRDALAARQREGESAQRSLDDEYERWTLALKTAEQQVAEQDSGLAAAQSSLSVQQVQCDDLHTEIRRRAERRIAAQERLTVLQEIEERQEGIGDGVQFLLHRAQAGTHPVDSHIRGMVADRIDVVEREFAEMIAAALGDRAQHLIVTGREWIDALEHESPELAGRVGVVRIPSAPPPEWPVPLDLQGAPGVLGRADQFVTSSDEYRYLVEWLLGDTWLVESLPVAIRLSRQSVNPVRFVTRRGEVLERDGRLLIGPATEGHGLISRRAELRELRDVLDRLEHEARALQASLEDAEHQRAELQRDVERLQLAGHEFAQQKQEYHLRLAAIERQRQELVSQRVQIDGELGAAVEREQQARRAGDEAERHCEQLRDERRSVHESIQTCHDGLQACEARRTQASDAKHAAELQVAAMERRLEAVRQQTSELERAHREQMGELVAARQEFGQLTTRNGEIETRLLAASSSLSELVLRFETRTRDARELTVVQQTLAESLAKARSESQEQQEQLHSLELADHQHELEAERLRMERQTLADRLREDYGLAVDECESQLTDDEQAARDDVDREIADLRRRLSHLGAVNMDALSELQDLETRFEHLSSQYRDLVEAKAALERIIQKINGDSRRLYSETLEAVRANFQVLFRKVFGGGRADIVLEEDKDLLESGLEIVATPPGKHSLGLSLLSGGERALTAVTLLMALFQYRPSPFCVLDEVDGPLDEANIGRFVGVLREFLEWTKFVVVTHSKKTMTAANTLYGVTMQESGVSKRVSVRFEDVNDRGEILRSSDDEAA